MRGVEDRYEEKGPQQVITRVSFGPATGQEPTAPEPPAILFFTRGHTTPRGFHCSKHIPVLEEVSQIFSLGPPCRINQALFTVAYFVNLFLIIPHTKFQQ